MIVRISLQVLLALTLSIGMAQNQRKIDSLLLVTKSDETVKRKAYTYNVLAYEYLSSDSALTAKYANEAIRLSIESDYQIGVADGYFRIAWTTMNSGYHDKAVELFVRSLEEAEKGDYKRGVSEAYFGIGVSYYYISSYDSAIAYYEKAIAIRKEIEDWVSVANISYSLGQIHTKRGDFNSALEVYEKALETQKERLGKEEDPKKRWIIHRDIASNYNTSGIAHYKLGNYLKAKYYYEKSDSLSRAIDYEAGVHTATNNLGNVFSTLGDLSKALGFYLESLALKEKLNDQRGIAAAYENIASIHYQREAYEEAISYSFESLEILEKIGDKSRISFVYYNMAQAYRKNKNLDKAEEYTTKSLVLIQEIKSKYGEVLCNQEFGEIALERSEYSKARTYFETALTQAKEISSQPTVAGILSSLGDTYLSEGKLIFARKYASEAFSIFRSLEDVEGIRDVSKKIAEIEEALGNQESAISAYKRYHHYYDTLLGLEKSKQLALLQIQYETEKKEQEIENLNQRSQIQSLELESKNQNLLVMSVFTAFLILGLVLVYVVYRQKQLSLKRKAEEVEQRLLRLQMNPHFIFNSLSSIQEFVLSGDEKSASKYLTKFSRLIREVLDHSRSEFISLDQEVSLLDNYLSLQNLKRSIPFEYEIAVDDEIETEELAIPPMFAQPFIENAIEHGLTGQTKNAKITVRFTLDNEYLVLEVSDNGIGVLASTKTKNSSHKSLATKITKERIELLKKTIKKDISFEMNSSNNGTSVTFNLPYQ